MSATLNEQLRERIRHLNTWKKGGQRAPHKPLLLLLALSRLSQGERASSKLRGA